jgi:RNA polymerase subunit RPABC4/transcription elongation factor Spt4
MAKSSYLKICKSCGEDFAKSAKECPHCGKKVQSGMLLMLIIGIGCLAMAAAFGIPVNKGQSDNIKNIVAAAVDTVNTAELASLLNQKNAQTSPQAQRKATEITGKIVQWNLEVFVATKSGDFYQVVTKSTPDVPGTLLRVYPRNNQQKNYLDSIKPGSRIQVKGKISGTQQGRIKIDPAFII